MRRIAGLAVASVLLVGIVGVSYWAGSRAVAPPEIPVEDHPVLTYQVEIGTVARSVRVSVTASWATTRTLFAGAGGVVTSVSHSAGGFASPGDAIATIDLEPVVVATGEVPMFRPLQLGVEGADVAQLQQLLQSQGFLARPPDGRFDTETAAAASEWQRAVGATADGVVGEGSLLFVAYLPARLEVLATVGERIGAGDDMVRVLDERPDFVATVSDSTRAELATGMTVAIDAPDRSTWHGELGAFQPLDDGRYSASVTGDPCGQACDLVPVAGETALSGRIELVPETRGVVVPTSALVQGSGGALAVTLADGTSRVVRVVAEADGFAVVDGLKAGTAIRLPSPP